MTECAEVALDIRDVLDGLGLELFPKTSGSKGLQLYLPLNTPHTHEHAVEFALAVAQMLEKHHPDKRRLEHEEGAAQGQGAHRLEPELPAQDDDLRLLAAGPAAPDGVDAGHLGRGRGGRRRSGLSLRGGRRARPGRRARRPLRPTATLEQTLPASQTPS